VRNAHWYDGNVVLVGDAAHTAHFSIGSGTVLALCDAIALADVLGTAEEPDLPAALAEYERRRKAALELRGRAAAVSMAWFENVQRRLDSGDPVRFAYDLFNRQGDQPSWRYPLHVLTQNPMLRRGRRVFTVARQQRREARRT
jgi:2-polyprenyl-6-methoxyphenol hydroxylase-like FAD-dependent oxidoreductase